MARTHKVRGASKGPKAGAPGRPRKAPAKKAPAPSRFAPPAEEDLVLEPSTAAMGLVVKRDTPAGPELRLLANPVEDVAELLEWLGVDTMWITFGEG